MDEVVLCRGGTFVHVTLYKTIAILHLTPTILNCGASMNHELTNEDKYFAFIMKYDCTIKHFQGCIIGVASQVIIYNPFFKSSGTLKIICIKHDF